jgi:hypothetical protein
MNRYCTVLQHENASAQLSLPGVVYTLMLPLEARLRLKWQGERAEFCRNGRQTKPGHATK